ncbi:hypothetical protein D3C75_950660 [compost metagenome]
MFRRRAADRAGGAGTGHLRHRRDLREGIQRRCLGGLCRHAERELRSCDQCGCRESPADGPGCHPRRTLRVGRWRVALQRTGCRQRVGVSVRHLHGRRRDDVLAHPVARSACPVARTRCGDRRQRGPGYAGRRSAPQPRVDQWQGRACGCRATRPAWPWRRQRAGVFGYRACHRRNRST